MAWGSSPVANTLWQGNGNTTSSAVNSTGADTCFGGSGAYNGGGAGSASFGTDSKGNVYTGLTQSPPAGNVFSQLFYAKNCTVGSGHTIDCNSAFFSAAFLAFAGGDLTAPLDQQNTGTSSGSTTNTGSITTGSNGELCIATFCPPGPSSNRSTPSGIFVISDGVAFGGFEGIEFAWGIQTTAGAISCDFTGYSNTGSTAAIGSFKAAAGGGSITGTAAWTEAQDTWAGAGAVAISGTAAWTEGKDIWAGAGAVTSSGPAAWTEAPDIWAGAGTVAAGISGSAAWIEGPDIWAGAGAVAISGSAAWAELQDIWAGTGTITLPAITGTAAWTEAPDRWAGTGSNGAFDLLDTGKKTKKANKARDKAIKEERERNAKRRQLVRDAFAAAFDIKIPMSEEVAQELVNAVEAKQENIPNSPNFEAILANLSNIEALWREYLEKDDEEVLVLL